MYFDDSILSCTIDYVVVVDDMEGQQVVEWMPFHNWSVDGYRNHVHTLTTREDAYPPVRHLPHSLPLIIRYGCPHESQHDFLLGGIRNFARCHYWQLD